MFDIGMTELLVIGLVALIVVGPKDLPGMFRTLGQFTAKAKRMAREFSRAMEDAADEAGVKDVANTVKAATNPTKMGLDKIREATNFDKFPEGSETQKLAKERAEAAEKIKAAGSKAADAAKPAAKSKTAKPKAAAKPKAKPKAPTKPKTPAKPKAAAKPKTAKAAAKPKAKPAAKPKPKAKKADT